MVYPAYMPGTKYNFRNWTLSIHIPNQACLLVGFLFLYSKQYENNFQKFEIETSFGIIIFILSMFGSHFLE